MKSLMCLKSWIMAAMVIALLVAIVPLSHRFSVQHCGDGAASAAVIMLLLASLIFMVVVVVARDKAEAALRRSEENLRLALQAAKQGIWQIDLLQRQCSLDSGSSEALGLEARPRTMSFDEFLKLVHPDDRPSLTPRLEAWECLRDGYVVEFRVVRPDGSIHWLRERGRAFGSDDHAYLAGVLVEISKDKEAERQLRRLNENLEGLVGERTAELKVTLQSLREGEERFRRVFEASADCISIWDVHLECLYANRAAIERWDGERDTLAGLGIKQALHHVPEVLGLWEGRVLQVLGSGSPVRHEDSITFNGEPFYSDMAALPLKDVNGKVFAVAVICRDVTDIRLAETRLRQAKDAAEVASRAKSEFIANMSHEIRTPLNSIMGFAQIMERHVSDPKLGQYLQCIKSSGKVLLDLINDILDLSKIEAGKLVLEYVPLRFAAVLDEMAQIFSTHALSKGIKLVVELDDGFPELLLFDETRLRQILLNLLGNAVKFTDSGRITARATHSMVSERSARVTLTVEDSGIGIPPDKLALVFNSFEQAVPHGRKNSGAGLGLAITKRLVEMLGGTISVDSQEGKGSMFTVVWTPVAVASGGDAPPAGTSGRPAAADFAAATIMVINDIHGDRERLKGLLVGQGAKVIESGHDIPGVMALLRQCRPDVVVVDLRADAEQDARTIAALRGDAATCDIPVVATCTTGLPPDIKVDVVLVKPFALEELKSRLSRYIPKRTGKVKPVLAPPATGADDAVGARDKEVKALRRLELEFLPRWNGRDCFSVGEIVAFSQELHRLGEEDDVRLLTAWSEDLLQCASRFDLRLTEEKLESFPDVLGAIRKKQLEAKEQHG